MTPLTVTAQLQAGVAHAGPWGIALDGLLAGVVHAQRKAELLAAGGEHIPLVDQEDVPDLDLPLSRCAHDGDWHWAATCAWPGPDVMDRPPEVVTWITRPDHRHLTDLTGPDVRQHVDEDAGRYRRYAMPLLVTLTEKVTWRAVGDPDRIREILQHVSAIGKKRTSGHGHVTSWDVDECPDLTGWAAAHTHPDGSLGRPTPRSCLQLPDAQTLTADPTLGPAGLRPPYSHPSRQREHLLLPYQ